MKISNFKKLIGFDITVVLNQAHQGLPFFNPKLSPRLLRLVSCMMCIQGKFENEIRF